MLLGSYLDAWSYTELHLPNLRDIPVLSFYRSFSLGKIQYNLQKGLPACECRRKQYRHFLLLNEFVLLPYLLHILLHYGA